VDVVHLLKVVHAVLHTIVMDEAILEMLDGAQTVLMALMKANNAVMQDILLMAIAQTFMAVMMYLTVAL